MSKGVFSIVASVIMFAGVGVMVYIMAQAPSVEIDLDTGGPLLEPQVEQSIEKGLQFLAKSQLADGSWSDEKYGTATAMTASACLAFISCGHLPGEGPYGDTVESGLQFLIKSIRSNGLIYPQDANMQFSMYSHGLSTLFLAEIYGMDMRPEIERSLKAAVSLIVTSQNEEGGWRYRPDSTDADISVTIMQLVALRAAYNAGIPVPKSTIDNAVAYVKKCYDPSGGFKYQVDQGGPAPARSAAGVCALLVSGEYDTAEVAKGIDYIWKVKDGNKSYFHYFHYYASQAVHLFSEKDWKKWYVFEAENMLERQSEDGSWDDTIGGKVVSTSFAILVLSIPYGYLPIYQR